MTPRTYTAAQVAEWLAWYYSQQGEHPSPADVDAPAWGIAAYFAAKPAPAEIDWAKVPKGCNVLTMDPDDGRAVAWTGEPACAGMWYGGGVYAFVPALDNYVPRDQWRESLRRRPT